MLMVTISILPNFTAWAEEQSSKRYGLGFILGNQTALTAKMNYLDNRAVDAGLGWSLDAKYDRLVIYADHLWTKPELLSIDKAMIDVYYGAGGRIFVETEASKSADVILSARFPLGIRYYFSKPRIEIFSELALIFNILPSMQSDADFGIGARYYF